MKKIKMKINHKRPYVIPVLLLSMILIYFYLGIFFDPGVNYYDHFLTEQKTSTENPITVYKGTASEGKVILTSTVMNQTDRLLEVTIGEETKEYVIESTLDCTEVRLFDSNNSLILEGTIDIDEGTITTSQGTELNYGTYRPIEGELYNEANPDPIMLIIIANGLGEVSRGDFSMLMFAGLLYFTYVVDLVFPDFFLRFKSLTYKGPVEMPKYYKKMQIISWFVVPIIIAGILIYALY